MSDTPTRRSPWSPSCLAFLIIVCQAGCSSSLATTDVGAPNDHPAAPDAPTADASGDEGSDMDIPLDAASDLGLDAARDGDGDASDEGGRTDASLDRIEILPADVPECTDSSPAAGCLCLVTSGGLAGICVTPRAADESNHCVIGTCPPGLVCVVQDFPVPSSVVCESPAVCAAIRSRMIRPPTYPSLVECRYSDGTPFESGIVPLGVCPASVANLLCGRGCPPCSGQFGICWAASERFPTGACMEPGPSCTESGDCQVLKPGYGCLRPRNLDGLGRPALGQCMPMSRCTAVGEALSTHFQCLP